MGYPSTTSTKGIVITVPVLVLSLAVAAIFFFFLLASLSSGPSPTTCSCTPTGPNERILTTRAQDVKWVRDQIDANGLHMQDNVLRKGINPRTRAQQLQDLNQ